MNKITFRSSFWLCFIVLSILITFSLAVSIVLAEPWYQAELIFEPEKRHNHSSSIVETPGGDLLVCWYNGSGERKADDCLIQGARMKHGSRKWSPRFQLADTPLYPDTNPCLFFNSKGKLFLFYATILNNQWAGALLKVRTSTHIDGMDGAPRWDWQDIIHVTPKDFHLDFLSTVGSHPEMLKGYDERESDFDEILLKLRDKLSNRLGWFMRAHPIEIPGTNKMIVPLYSDLYDNSLMVWTEDEGQTWSTGKPIIGYGAVQPSVVRKKNGALNAFMRDNGGFGYIQFAESTDEGATWSPARTLDIPNPGASVEVISLTTGEWIMVTNDTKNGRHSLVVMASPDEGSTWPWIRHLDKAERGKGSFSYPSVIQARDGNIHVTYSYVPGGGLESIKHAAFNLEWVKAGD